MEKNICRLKFKDEDANINANLILNNIHKDIITNNFDKTNLYNNDQNITITEEYITFIIITNKIMKKNNNKMVDLGECEIILKNKYNLDSTENLIFLIINVKNNGMEKNKLVYEVYMDLKGDNILSKLDLNVCNETLKNNEIYKCSDYSIESLIEDLCISCINTYYPKYNDTINNPNSFIKCYNSIKGYYLDNNIFKKCYKTCESCIIGGNEKIHNCQVCSSDYTNELHIGNSINCYKKCEFNTYYDIKSNKNYCTPDLLCPNDYNKLIPAKNICISECDEDKDYQYEFRHTCYNKCPYNSSKESQSKNNYCDAICPKDLPFEIILTQECVDKCTIAERQNSLCIINYESKDESDKEAEEKAVENIREDLTQNFNTSNIDKGENIVIKQKDSTITITTSDNQKNEKSYNTSTINLGECENKIKKEYNIPKEKSLYILKIDIKQEGFQTMKIDYEVYYPLFGNELIKLNLTVCENTKIDLSIPTVLSDDIDKMNASSGYYNDICYTYTSENGTDISLSDRKKDFVNNNLTVCEEDCDFVDYDNIYKKAICSCKVKTNSSMKIGNIVIDKNKLYDSFTNINNIANIKVLNCYKLIFKIEAYKSNYANLILLLIILLFFITVIVFYCKDNPELMQLIDKIIFLKSNSKIIKKIVIQKKKEKEGNKLRQKNTENNSKFKCIQNERRLTIRNGIRNNEFINNINNINKIQIIRPIYLAYSKYIKPDKPNPLKKIQKNDKGNIIKVKYKLNGKEITLNEEQIYELFLKINKLTHNELNNLSYKEALKKDKRTYCIYYISLITTKHLLIFSFLPILDYNSQILKIFIFFFNFCVNFTTNALFFTDDTMHEIYTDGGKFNFIYNIPQILYSSLISGFINALIKILALSDSKFIELRKYKKYKNKIDIKQKGLEVKNILKIKFLILFIVNLLLLVLFWFYLACFCAVYKNTQIHLIKDSLISFGTSMLYPFCINLIPGIFRIIALNGKNREYLYNFSKIVQML